MPSRPIPGLNASRPTDFNDVVLFVRVVRAGSFSAAARELRVPVSTVSRRIARLESVLDARLLARTTRTLRLTDLGKTYLEHAERAMDELREADELVRAAQAVPRGRVRITAPLGLGASVTRALASYLERYPLVSVELDLTERRVDLQANAIDLAVRSGPIDGDVVARKLSTSSRGIYASSRYLERRGRPKRIDDLASHDLIAVSRSSIYGTVWTLIPSAKSPSRTVPFSFTPRFSVSNLMAAKEAAMAGIGIALLPAQHVADGELQRILPNVTGQPGELWLVYSRRRKALSAAVRTCMDHLVGE